MKHVTIYGKKEICTYETIINLKNGEVYYVYSNELPNTSSYIFMVHADDGSVCGMNVTEYMNYIEKWDININV